MEELLVSVVIPTYNGAMRIEKAVDSVLQQTYKNIEIIIIDDKSVDETLKIIGGLRERHPNIFVLTNKNNSGTAKSLNKGIAQARGKYIARLDDDDYWLPPEKLKKQISFLESNESYGLVGGGIIKIDESGKEIGRYLFPESDADIRRSILVNNLFAHSAVVFRKDIFEKVGGYEEQFDFFSDRDLWLKMGRVCKFYNFQDFFIDYLDKERGKNYKKRNLDIRRRISANIKLRMKYKDDYEGFWKSIFLCIASYFYSFLPFQQKLYPALIKLRVFFWGPLAYKYFNSDYEGENKNEKV